MSRLFSETRASVKVGRSRDCRSKSSCWQKRESSAGSTRSTRPFLARPVTATTAAATRSSQMFSPGPRTAAIACGSVNGATENLARRKTGRLPVAASRRGRKSSRSERTTRHGCSSTTKSNPASSSSPDSMSEAGTLLSERSASCPIHASASPRAAPATSAPRVKTSSNWSTTRTGRISLPRALRKTWR